MKLSFFFIKKNYAHVHLKEKRILSSPLLKEQIKSTRKISPSNRQADQKTKKKVSWPEFSIVGFIYTGVKWHLR